MGLKSKNLGVTIPTIWIKRKDGETFLFFVLIASTSYWGAFLFVTLQNWHLPFILIILLHRNLEGEMNSRRNRRWKTNIKKRQRWERNLKRLRQAPIRFPKKQWFVVTMQRTMVTAKGQRDSVTLQNHYLCEKKEIILHCKIRDNQIVKVKIQTSILWKIQLKRLR